uniref:Putative secreted protein n=1 Tax=Ixodes ricinus TaxID=34613 RepID=A0A6B0U1Z1_IXORI
MTSAAAAAWSSALLRGPEARSLRAEGRSLAATVKAHATGRVWHSFEDAGNPANTAGKEGSQAGTPCHRHFVLSNFEPTLD